MVRIKNILCPVDFSEFSRHAFEKAAAIARGQGASVAVLHVAPFQAIPTFPYSEPAAEVLMRSAGDLEKVANEVKRFLAIDASIGVPVTCEALDAPNVHHEILAQADRLSADLIVMGTHGRSGFQRLLLGSVTEKVLRTARQPVLTVGAPVGAVQAGTGSFTRILCAIDFSECSIAGLEYAVSLTQGSDARLTAINVIEWTPIGYDPVAGLPIDLAGYRMAAETTARERLHQVVADATPTWHDVEEVVTSGKSHHEILRVGSERGSDLIVLGIHGRNPIGRMVFGSTAEPVVRRATCPVLTVRADVAADTTV
jgi:nucleotide-binding universal stress UspA family protein